MSIHQLHHDARHRLAGYLLAQGFVDRHQREAVVTALEHGLGPNTDHAPDSPQWVAQAITLFEAWHDGLLERVTDAEQRHAARQWLVRHLREQLAMHLDAFDQPDAFARHLSVEMNHDNAMAAPLPKAHPQDMPRQPLGELPAVMRGSFWVSTARWAMPMKSRHHTIEPDLALGEEPPTQ